MQAAIGPIAKKKGSRSGVLFVSFLFVYLPQLYSAGHGLAVHLGVEAVGAAF